MTTVLSIPYSLSILFKTGNSHILYISVPSLNIKPWINFIVIYSPSILLWKQPTYDHIRLQKTYLNISHDTKDVFDLYTENDSLEEEIKED